MAIQYHPAPIDILKFLGCTERKGEMFLEDFASKNNIKLPPLLFDFLSLAWEHPLFRTSDLWVSDRLGFYYEELEETIEEWEEDWKEDPQAYEEDFLYQMSKIPKEQWPERVPDYLQIGSDYGAGVVTFGICVSDLDQPDPPVYRLHEADEENEWVLMDESLSMFLMRVLADTLSCSEYDTAMRVLEKAGWQCSKSESMSEAQERADKLGIDLSKAAQCGALYAAAVTPDVCRYCYIEDKNTFFLLKDDTGNHLTTCVILTKN